MKNNCSRKQVCEISTEEMFQSAGICGREAGSLDSIRNWIHIKHSCYGDIPGETCQPITTTTTTTTSQGASHNIHFLGAGCVDYNVNDGGWTQLPREQLKVDAHTGISFTPSASFVLA